MKSGSVPEEEEKGYYKCLPANMADRLCGELRRLCHTASPARQDDGVSPVWCAEDNWITNWDIVDCALMLGWTLHLNLSTASWDMFRQAYMPIGLQAYVNVYSFVQMCSCMLMMM